MLIQNFFYVDIAENICIKRAKLSHFYIKCDFLHIFVCENAIYLELFLSQTVLEFVKNIFVAPAEKWHYLLIYMGGGVYLPFDI